MIRRSCSQEAEVVQAVLGRRWPDACDPSLREHAGRCEVCRDVVAVAALLQEDDEAERDANPSRDMQLPSAGQIWWRAAVRARAEAAHRATRPLVWGYGIVAACTIGLVVAAAGVLGRMLVPVVERVGSLTWWVPPRAVSAADALVAAVRAQLPLVVGVVAFLVAAQIAVYLALRED